MPPRPGWTCKQSRRSRNQPGCCREGSPQAAAPAALRPILCPHRVRPVTGESGTESSYPTHLALIRKNVLLVSLPPRLPSLDSFHHTMPPPPFIVILQLWTKASAPSSAAPTAASGPWAGPFASDSLPRRAASGNSGGRCTFRWQYEANLLGHALWLRTHRHAAARSYLGCQVLWLAGRGSHSRPGQRSPAVSFPGRGSGHRAREPPAKEAVPGRPFCHQHSGRGSGGSGRFPRWGWPQDGIRRRRHEEGTIH